MPLAISVPTSGQLNTGQILPNQLINLTGGKNTGVVAARNPCNDDIFHSSPGRIVSMDNCALPISITMQCFKPGDVFRAIITSIGISAQGGFQFMHTLSNFVFLYVFQERIGSMKISGVTFMGGCGNNPTAGIEAVLGYYDRLRTTRRYAPINVVVGRLKFKAFLLGVKADIADASSGLGSFSFDLFYPAINTSSLNLFTSEDSAPSSPGSGPGCL